MKKENRTEMDVRERAEKLVNIYSQLVAEENVNDFAEIMKDLSWIIARLFLMVRLKDKKRYEEMIDISFVSDFKLLIKSIVEMWVKNLENEGIKASDN